jgi:hypothetical protein
VRGRGRIDLMTRFCETCWNVFANEMAVTDGATAPQRPDTDPDDVSWIEPPICPMCGAFVRIYPTTYDRWVSLATVEMPAKAVPEPFRWRLMRLPDLSPRHDRDRGCTGPWSRSVARRACRAGSPHDVRARVGRAVDHGGEPARAPACPIERQSAGNNGSPGERPENRQVSVSPAQPPSAYAIFQTGA